MIPASVRDRIWDLLVAPFAMIALVVLRAARRRGNHRTPLVRKLYDRLGVYPVLDQYYEPLVVPSRHLTTPLDSVRELPGLNLRVEEQLALLSDLRFTDELLAIARTTTDELAPFYDNGNYVAGDAELLYSMIRHLKPRRVFEIGSGMSTRFVHAALGKNESESGTRGRHVCVEPYEMPWLERLGPEVVRKKVEDLDPDFFDALEDRDVLFIDSSHVIRPQGDVLAEYLRILPKLRPGVRVHVHDIFTPRDYPSSWVHEKRLLWNEQYLLEALLTDTDGWHVELAANFLANDHRAAFDAACPVFAEQGGVPGAFWIRRGQPDRP